jgi:ABC-type multidrug transport system ATPase subunit
MSNVETPRSALGVPGKVTAVIGPVGTGAPAVGSALSAGSWTEPLKQWGVEARAALCFVPIGAPLLLHRSAASNVRYLCLLGSRLHISDEAVRLALRLGDVRDDRFETRASRLSYVERLGVWLAVHRLRQTPTLIVQDPTQGLTPSVTKRVAGLLAEAADIPSAVIVTTPDPTFAASVGDQVVTPDQA